MFIPGISVWCKDEEQVELYRYFPNMPSWHMLGQIYSVQGSIILITNGSCVFGVTV